MSPVSKALVLMGCAAMAAGPVLAAAAQDQDSGRKDRGFLCGNDDGDDDDDGGLCGLEIGGIVIGVLALGVVVGGSSKSN